MPGKSQIADRIAARGWSRASALTAVEAVLGEITAALAAGERVTLTGFGTFEPAPRAARTARNPRTGASVDVAATTVARFHPGATLRAQLASGSGVALPGLPAAAAPDPVTASGRASRTSHELPDAARVARARDERADEKAAESSKAKTKSKQEKPAKGGSAATKGAKQKADKAKAKRSAEKAKAKAKAGNKGKGKSAARSGKGKKK